MFTPRLFSTLLLLGALAHAHPGEHSSLHPAELSRRQLEANERHIAARQCASSVAQFHARRKAKRALAKRQEVSSGSASATASVQPSGTASAIAPHFSTIQNMTCIAAPELTEGPYYIRNEVYRQDVRESQLGVDLQLDIGVLDVTTCEPLPNVIVEIWAANATGKYAGFTALGGGGGGGGGAAPSGGAGGPAPSGSDSAAMPSGSAMPSGGMGGGEGGGAGGVQSSSLTDHENWLRGGYSTDSNGVVEFWTKYPGFYQGRTIHVHVMVHQGMTLSENGTYVSESGSLRHIGQLFFEEELNYQVLNQTEYHKPNEVRTTNAEDTLIDAENADGYNVFVDTELLGSSIADGVLGYITIGVNTSATYSITTTNYWDPSGVLGEDNVSSGGSGTGAASASGTAVANAARRRMTPSIFSWFF